MEAGTRNMFSLIISSTAEFNSMFAMRYQNTNLTNIFSVLLNGTIAF